MTPPKKRPLKGGTQYFEEYFAGKDGELIKGDGDAADFQIYRRKVKMDSLTAGFFLNLYERIFTFAHILGVRHIYDIGCNPYLQATYLVHSPDMHYTGIDKRMFHCPEQNLFIEESYVNKVFEDFTGSDRIRFIKGTYPCELNVEENSIALLIGVKLIALVELEEPLLKKLASQFDRFVLDLVGRTNNTELRHMAVRDVVEQDVCNYEDIREEQLTNLRRILPDYEFYILGSSYQSYILYGTKIPSDRERILERYDLLGDRVVSDLIDCHWFFEMRR